MNVIRAELAPEFRGEDVVLLAMDSAGVSTLLTVLTQAVEHGASRLELACVMVRFHAQSLRLLPSRHIRAEQCRNRRLGQAEACNRRANPLARTARRPIAVRTAASDPTTRTFRLARVTAV